MCGETSPAFITWLGEVNLSEGGGIPSRDWKPTICQRQVGVARGCLDGLGKGLQGLRKAAVVIIAMRSRTPALLLAGF